MIKQLAKGKKEDGFVKRLEGFTPILLAVSAQDKNLDCVKTLIQNGADHLVRCGNGNTIAHHAALNGNKNILEFLISGLKIDTSLKNNKGLTVYEVAH